LKCAGRCPVGAISDGNGRDKEACCRKAADSLKYCKRHEHIFIHGRGLCAAGVPSEAGVPAPLGRDRD